MIAARPMQKLEVLIADDEAISREILQTYLESLGCSVQAAASGSEALKAFQEGTEWIRLVILDVCMPGPEPHELYEQIRRIKPSVPILFCSGISWGEPELRFIDEQGLQLLPKPFNRAALLQAALRVLKDAEVGA